MVVDGAVYDAGEHGRVPPWLTTNRAAAFRWWDRGEGRLLATSKPADSRLIEERFAAGQGLLRDGGAAVSTTYTGGAVAVLTSR